MPIRVAYLLADFPSRSETFIAREVAGLTRLGAEITIFSIRGRPTDEARKAAAQIGVGDLVYRRSPRPDGDDRQVRSASNVPVGSRLDPLNYYRATSTALALERLDLPVCLRAERNVPTAMSFAREIARRELRHVHAHFATVPTTLAFMIQSLTEADVSFSAHAQDIWLHWQTLAAKIRRAALTVTCNQHNRKALEGLCDIRQSGKIHAVYHGVDPDAFTGSVEDERPLPPLILAVGRLVPKKGFRQLVAACAKLRDEGVCCRCRIIGEGPEREPLEEMVAALRLAPLVDLAGYVPNETIAAHYREAALLACPSVFRITGDRDSLPNVILEAMAMSRPVVATNVSAIPEAVEHEVTGLLIPDADPNALARAIRRLLEDRALADRLARAGRRRVLDQFDYRRNARQIYTLFEELQKRVFRARGSGLH